MNVQRYDTRLDDDGTFFVEGPDEWVEIGSMEEICELVGGETYSIEYDDRERAAGWLETESDGRLTFDVRETLTGMTFDEEFVRTVSDAPLDAQDANESSSRTFLFVELMTNIWDSKGNIDSEG